MKKGISLIVLVITIIVMIIIAGAIIISLNSTNLIEKSDEAVIASDLANLKSELTLKYSDVILYNYDADNDDDASTEKYTVEQVTGFYQEIIEDYDNLESKGYTVVADDEYRYVISLNGATVQ